MEPKAIHGLPPLEGTVKRKQWAMGKNGQCNLRPSWLLVLGYFFPQSVAQPCTELFTCISTSPGLKLWLR